MVNTDSTSFTITPKQSDGSAGTFNGSITITPSGGGLSTPFDVALSGSSPQTFVIHPTATGLVTLTPSNLDGLDDPVAPVSYSVGSSLTTIDRTWLNDTNNLVLSSQPNGPWGLSTANAIYRLSTSLTSDPLVASDTAFIFLADGIILDLNGQTVTYCNRTTVSVPNGDFEDGTTNWDLSNASGSSVVTPAQANWKTGWRSAHLLEVTGVSGATKTILSGSITIPVAGRDYAAVATIKSQSFQSIDISAVLYVVDASNPSTILSAAPAQSVVSAYAPVALFTPVNTNSVKIKIDLIPALANVLADDVDDTTTQLPGAYQTYDFAQSFYHQILYCESEQMRIETGADIGTYVYVTRGYNGTQAVPHSKYAMFRTSYNAGTYTVDIDDVALKTTGEYGVFATPDWSGLSTQLQTSGVQSGVLNVHNATIRNGSIVAGNSKTFRGHVLCVTHVSRTLVVDNLTCTANGDDASIINAYYFGDQDNSNLNLMFLYVTNCHFTGEILRATNRRYTHPFIHLERALGTINVINNTIDGSGVAGIVVDGNMLYGSGTNFEAINIIGNNFYVDCLVTDAYAIGIAQNANSFEIAYNNINQVNGRGIALDGIRDDRDVIDGGTVHHNIVEVQESADLEYSDLACTAFRVRGTGRVSNVDVYENTFYSHTDQNQDAHTFGACLNWNNGAPYYPNANANFVLRDNIFKAITFDDAFEARALTVEGLSDGCNITIRDNICESNHVSFSMGDYGTGSGWSLQDLSFIGNTIKRSADGASMSNYYGMRFGDSNGSNNEVLTNIRLINTVPDTNESLDIAFYSTTEEWVTKGYLLTVHVTHGGSNVSGAVVTISDQSPTGTTDADGICVLPLSITKYSGDGTSGTNLGQNGNPSSEDLRQGPIVITASATIGGTLYTGTEYVSTSATTDQLMPIEI